MAGTRTLSVTLIALVSLAMTAAGHAQAPSATHDMLSSGAAVQWRPAQGIPPGASVAVISGDPSQAGQEFVVRIKMPDGYRIAPHWHPTDEHVTVLAGTFLAGMGEKFDESALVPLAVGGYSRLPPKSAHFVKTRGETIVQLHGTGPLVTTYVNPADDPRKKTGSQ